MYNRFVAHYSAAAVHLYGINPHDLASAAIAMHQQGVSPIQIHREIDQRIALTKVRLFN